MKNNKKGFTLAELLIVVAIIAVLVAIAIPIFTSQLEKSREATDAANIRDYYAEIAVALLDGSFEADEDGEVTLTGGLTATYADEDKDDGEFTVTVGDVTINQTQADWQMGDPIVAGYTFSGIENVDDVYDVVYTFTVDDTTYLSEISVGD